MSVPDPHQNPESKQLDEEYGTVTVNLNHLELMGIQMSLMKEKMDDGLSSPQLYAMRKIEIAFAEAMKKVRGE